MDKPVNICYVNDIQDEVKYVANELIEFFKMIKRQWNIVRNLLNITTYSEGHVSNGFWILNTYVKELPKILHLRVGLIVSTLWTGRDLYLKSLIINELVLGKDYVKVCDLLTRIATYELFLDVLGKSREAPYTVLLNQPLRAPLRALIIPTGRRGYIAGVLKELMSKLIDVLNQASKLKINLVGLDRGSNYFIYYVLKDRGLDMPYVIGDEALGTLFLRERESCDLGSVIDLETLIIKYRYGYDKVNEFLRKISTYFTSDILKLLKGVKYVIAKPKAIKGELPKSKHLNILSTTKPVEELLGYIAPEYIGTDGWKYPDKLVNEINNAIPKEDVIVGTISSLIVKEDSYYTRNI
ncbi:MAG: hypothetical protein DRO18_05250 [Thermoprotei archaeon]|nr:MAG: hypothetical protein DRO18_05250 [Thermoprotei archaeon]